MFSQGESNGLANSHGTASLFMSLVIVKCGRGSTYDKSRLTFQSLHSVDKEVLEFKLQNAVDFVAYSNLKDPKNAL
jgi:pyruvate kinase